MTTRLRCTLETATGGVVARFEQDKPLQQMGELTPSVVQCAMILGTAPEAVVFGTRFFVRTQGSPDEVGDLVYTEAYTLPVPLSVLEEMIDEQS